MYLQPYKLNLTSIRKQLMPNIRLHPYVWVERAANIDTRNILNPMQIELLFYRR